MHPLDDADGEPGDRSGGMNTAKVISARKGEVPNSGRDALSIITDEPYLVCGEVGTSTGILCRSRLPGARGGRPGFMARRDRLAERRQVEALRL